MADLQKFRRRLIRSVSRLLYKEKKEPDEVWEYLKKETKCDCEALWKRMRSLTLKKLNRLLAASDQSDNIAPVARMTLTDWLFFDLVLVHENIDFIGLDRLEKGLTEYKPLIDLYNLVQRFEIETRKGNELADAWTAATITYNRQGRQCSPMLLQKRWHQLKSLTRDKFYNFWAVYKGLDRLLDTALAHKPTALQMSIAKTYPSVICETLKTWDESVEAGLIILPETFETKMGMKNQSKTTQELIQGKMPDVELIEDTIETIDLGQQSDLDENGSMVEDNSNLDSENNNGLNEEAPSSNITIVKQEPTDEEDVSNDVIEKTNQVDLNLQCLDQMESMIEDIENPTKVITAETKENSNDSATETNMELTSTELYSETGDNSKDINKDVEEIIRNSPELKQDSEDNSDNIKGITEENTREKDSKDVHESLDIPHKSSVIEKELEKETQITSLNDSMNITEVITVEKEIETTNFKVSVNMSKVRNLEDSNIVKGTAAVSGSTTEILEINTSDEENIDDENSEAPVNIYDTIKDEAMVCEDSILKTLEDSNTVEETAVLKTENAPEILEINTSDEEKVDGGNSKASSNNYDTVKDLESTVCDESMLKTLLTSYKNKRFKSLDEGKADIDKNIQNEVKSDKFESPAIRPEILNPFDIILPDIEFVDDGIEFVDDGIAFGDNMEDKNITLGTKGSPREDKDETVAIDEKLLLTPVVYTKKLDDMNLFKDKVFSLCDINFINQVALESKPVSKLASNFETNDEAKIDTSDDNDDLFCNNISSEIDSEDKSIDESFKVKITSYLLQKPKTRIYNPIQLCKNPDFNTRLRRLSLGFFGHPRNRDYIHACIPVTIDLHKAFESKLIDGTLYLKPSIKTDNVVVKEETKIEEPKENVTSVKPTPMPMQSLIDSSNSNIQDLVPPSEIKKPDLPINEPIICERNKVISLPDKDRIRQINQQLLVAQVAPIIQNETTLDSPSKPATESEEVLSIPVPEEISIEKSKKEGINVDENVPHSNEATNPFDWKKKLCVKKPKPKQITVPWKSVTIDYSKIKYDYLLARDTLSKVLFVLGSENNKKTEFANENTKKCTNSTLKVTENNLNPKKCSKTKAALEVTNDDCVVPKTKVVFSARSRNRKSRKKIYCCWANKTLQSIQTNCRLRIGIHTCLPNMCRCCCRDLLTQEKDKQRRAPLPKLKPKVIELSEDEVEMQKACASIESVVKQAHDPKNVPFLVPAASNNAEVSNITFNISITKPDIVIDHEMNDSPFPESTNNIETSIPIVDNDIDLVSTSELTTPISIESHSLLTPCPETPTTSRAPTNYSISPTNPVIKKIIPVKRPRVQVVPCQCKEPNIVASQNRHLIIDGSITCPIHSRNVRRYQNTQKSKTKDTVLFVNKSRDGQSPIFVGHNKILLTSVSYNESIVPIMPKLSPIPVQNTALITARLVQTPEDSTTKSVTDNSVLIPNGVELKLLDDGKLTYSVDPGVTLSDTVLASLPTVVSTLQEQIDVNKALNSTSEFVANGSSEVNAENTSEINKNLNNSASMEDLNKNAPSVDINTTEQSTTTDPDLEIPAPEPLHDESNSLQDEIQQRSNSVTKVVDNEQLIHKDSEGSASKLETTNSETKDTNPTTTNNEQKTEEDKVKSKSTLLSDLMEMSGILAEDTLPVVQEPMTSSVTFEPVPTITEPQTEQVNYDHQILANNNEIPKDPLQLSVIHSFAHLKYACQQNGLFFKLDLETSILVSINVCLKRNSPKQNKNENECIDLTLESDEKHEESHKDLNEETISIITNESSVKPLKLFKSLRPRILSNTKNRKESIKKILRTVTSEEVRCRKVKRKQDIIIRKNNIEAKINLVDSDEPMEEEYLEDYTDDEQESYSSKHLQKRNREVSGDESSDDEPLAKKVQRKQKEIKEKAKKKQKNNVNRIENVALDEDMTASDEGLDTIMELPPQVVVDSIEMVTESEEGPTALAFLNNEQNSSGEEDCILGF